ncbi:hypothetical protein D9M70_649780 [compost metagenome]
MSGVAKVLSATTSAPARLAAATRRRISSTLRVGLVGVSRYSRSQPLAISCSMASVSRVSQRVTSTPMRGRNSSKILLVPP